MKKTIAILCVATAALTTTGCRQLEWAGDKIYTPVTATNIVDTPTGSYPTVVTNGWIVKPSVQQGVTIAGDLAPVPWGSFISSTLLALLGVGAHLRGRQWQKAALSGVSAAQAFKEQLKVVAPSAAQQIKKTVATEQRTNGTKSLIEKLLNKF